MPYNRRSHKRTSKLGNSFFVREHTVSEHTGDAGYVKTNYADQQSYTIEGTCKYCEEKVFFYRNENGGFAVFDALGKPWPKHPCFGVNYEEFSTVSQNRLSQLEENFLSGSTIKYIESLKNKKSISSIIISTEKLRVDRYKPSPNNEKEIIDVYRVVLREKEYVYDIGLGKGLSFIPEMGIMIIKVKFTKKEKEISKTFPVCACKQDNNLLVADCVIADIKEIDFNINDIIFENGDMYKSRIKDISKLRKALDINYSEFPFIKNSKHKAKIKHALDHNKAIYNTIVDFIFREYDIYQDGNKFYKNGIKLLNREDFLYFPKKDIDDLMNNIITLEKAEKIDFYTSDVLGFLISYRKIR